MHMDLGSGPGENISPDEGGGGGGEALSEEAKARFAGAAAAGQQVRKEEKKAKRRDDGVAQMIIQFLTDTQRQHLATLISRLVGLNCPSPFLLAVLSLINKDCAHVVEEYLSERGTTGDVKDLVLPNTKLDADTAAALEKWILRMELTLSLNPEETLKALVVEEGNVDGTVLQLTTFVLEAFLKEHGKNPVFPDLQRVTIGILQSVFESYMHLAPLPSGEKEKEE